jgi:hypothetical protein
MDPQQSTTNKSKNGRIAVANKVVAVAKKRTTVAHGGGEGGS